MTFKDRKAPRSATMIAFAKAMKLFVGTPRVLVADVVETTGVHKTTATRLVHTLHKERVIYISGWAEDAMGRDHTPIFSFGDHEDVPRKKRSGAERSRDYRDRKRAALKLQKGLNREY